MYIYTTYMQANTFTEEQRMWSVGDIWQEYEAEEHVVPWRTEGIDRNDVTIKSSVLWNMT
jgi:hypothetical protein